MDYKNLLEKLHIRRHSQVVRHRSAKPRFPSSSLGGASIKKHLHCKCFFHFMRFAVRAARNKLDLRNDLIFGRGKSGGKTMQVQIQDCKVNINFEKTRTYESAISLCDCPCCRNFYPCCLLCWESPESRHRFLRSRRSCPVTAVMIFCSLTSPGNSCGRISSGPLPPPGAPGTRA